MRILFAGTPELAILPLESISKSYCVCGVLTAPDGRAGRGRKTSSSPVKKKSLALGIPVFQPEKISADFREKVRELRPDILVVAAFSKIFKKQFLDLFPMGGINLHPSLLPKYRGPSPLQACLLAGDRDFGVTVQRLALRMDAGAILAQQRVSITGTETAADVAAVASRYGSLLLLKVLNQLETGQTYEVPQVEAEATYCKMLQKEDGLIDWEYPAEVIERMVRAYQPWPKAYTIFRGLKLYLLKAGIVPNQDEPRPGVTQAEHKPGLVSSAIRNVGLVVQTGKGNLAIKRLQLQSKKAADWQDFYNGQRDILKYHLGG